MHDQTAPASARPDSFCWASLELLVLVGYEGENYDRPTIDLVPVYGWHLFEAELRLVDQFHLAHFYTLLHACI